MLNTDELNLLNEIIESSLKTVAHLEENLKLLNDGKLQFEDYKIKLEKSLKSLLDYKSQIDNFPTKTSKLKLIKTNVFNMFDSLDNLTNSNEQNFQETLNYETINFTLNLIQLVSCF